MISNPFARTGYDTRPIFNMFEFRVFLLLRQVASPRLKSLDCPTIYPQLEGE